MQVCDVVQGLMAITLANPRAELVAVHDEIYAGHREDRTDGSHVLPCCCPGHISTVFYTRLMDAGWVWEGTIGAWRHR